MMRIKSSIALFFLALRVHFDALTIAPGPYLVATKWRILGKRVRARGKFAPLLAKSPKAYQWKVSNETTRREPSPPGRPPIYALITYEPEEGQLNATLKSLATENIEAFVIGPDSAADLDRIANSIDWSADPWLMPIGAGDRLAPGGAQTYRAAMYSDTTRVIYSDDDLIDAKDQFASPHYKPKWNSELFRQFDYITGACVVRVRQAELREVIHEADWAGALVAWALAASGEAMHIDMVLHHRRLRRAPRSALPILRPANVLPKVTVVIPTRNKLDLLSTCIAGLNCTDYLDLEIIVVDNESDDPATLEFLADLPACSTHERSFRVIRHMGPFNYSAINNRAIHEAKGEVICLLNNDVEIVTPEWLAIMVTQAMRDEVGAVGAQLLYPDGRIQHAGVVIGVGNAAGHAHRFLLPESEGYYRRHSLPHFVSAVTAACLVVMRDRFLAVGGLDEVGFPVAFNDVDLCLKLNSQGWQSLYEPRAVLIHHESVSRGFDKDPVGAARFARELAALKRRWHTDSVTDPFHHPQLSRASEQFTIALQRDFFE